MCPFRRWVTISALPERIDHLALFSGMFEELEEAAWRLFRQVSDPAFEGYVPDTYFTGHNVAAYTTRESAAEQLGYLSENITRMSINLRDYWTQGGTNAPF